MSEAPGKPLPAVQETRVQSLDWEDPLEKGKATHSGVPAWRIHGQRGLSGYCPWGHEESDTTAYMHVMFYDSGRVIFFF